MAPPNPCWPIPVVNPWGGWMAGLTSWGVMAAAPGLGMAGVIPGWPIAGVALEPARFGASPAGLTALTGLELTNALLVRIIGLPNRLPVCADALSDNVTAMDVAKGKVAFQILINSPLFRAAFATHLNLLPPPTPCNGGPLRCGRPGIDALCDQQMR